MFIEGISSAPMARVWKDRSEDDERGGASQNLRSENREI